MMDCFHMFSDYIHAIMMECFHMFSDYVHMTMKSNVQGNPMSNITMHNAFHRPTHHAD